MVCFFKLWMCLAIPPPPSCSFISSLWKFLFSHVLISSWCIAWYGSEKSYCGLGRMGTQRWGEIKHREWWFHLRDVPGCHRLCRAAFSKANFHFRGGSDSACSLGTVEMSRFALRQWLDPWSTPHVFSDWDYLLQLIIAHRKYIKDLYSSLNIFCYSSVMKHSGYINWQMHTWGKLLSFRNC